MAKFILYQENGLHLLQRWGPTSTSTKYIKNSILFYRDLNISLDCSSFLGDIRSEVLIYLFFSSSVEQGFCSTPWIPYNGHCFHLQRNAQTWSGAQKACRAEGGDLATVRNVEDQSFVISQLGYGMWQSYLHEIMLIQNRFPTANIFHTFNKVHMC